MKVLQGVTGQAGQPWALAQALRRLGIQADSCSIVPHKFGYPAHVSRDVKGITSLEQAHERLGGLIANYDVFHFHARSFLADWPLLRAPALHDLALIRLAGKRIFFHFRGQEVRRASVFRQVNPFHYADDDEAGKLFARMPDASKDIFVDAVRSLSDAVFVVDEELATYVPGAIVVPRALASADWPDVGIGDRDVPVIVHAPSRRQVKGTAHVIRAVEALQAEGVRCELRLVEGLSHAEAVAIYRDADIVVDQLRIGWYGVLAVEAMALGKPVVAYIRDDLHAAHGASLPVANASPVTIKEQLRRLLGSAEERRRLSRASRLHFERVHADDVVARQLRAIYEAPARPRDLTGFMTLLAHQKALEPAPASPPPPPRRLAAALRLWRDRGTAALMKQVGRGVARRLDRRRPDRP